MVISLFWEGEIKIYIGEECFSLRCCFGFFESIMYVELVGKLNLYA